MEKLQQLEQRIRELVPSLQELSFGCKVFFYPYKSERLTKGRIVDKTNDVITIDCIDSIEKVEKENLSTIIGHPILLHHVLQAVYSDDDREEDQLSFVAGIAENNLFFAKQGSDSTAIWDLTKPLSEQSPETISFLWDLLNK